MRSLENVARTIVNVNLDLQKKDAVLIICGPDSLEFAELLAFECWKVGAMPQIEYGSDKLSLKVYQTVKTEYLNYWPKVWDATSKLIDAEIIIDDSNPFIASRLPQKKVEVRRKKLKPIRDRMEKRTIDKNLKIALVGYPNMSTAKALGISFRKLNKIFWDTMNIDYNALYNDTLAFSRKFSRKNKIRIIGEKTDLELSIKGRKPILDCGIVNREKFWYLNLPAGEVFFAPVETAANGEIFFDLPCMWHYGKQVQGVWFRFKRGRVVEYQIDKGEEAFEEVMKNASGSKDRIAELGIGMNPNARPTGGLTIVDEKIKGTIHMAIGANKHFGGRNKSTIHWDFFKDMRKKAEMMLVDSKVIMKNGVLMF